jgi:hypothetical protein
MPTDGKDIGRGAVIVAHRAQAIPVIHLPD